MLNLTILLVASRCSHRLVVGDIEFLITSVYGGGGGGGSCSKQNSRITSACCSTLKDQCFHLCGVFQGYLFNHVCYI